MNILVSHRARHPQGHASRWLLALAVLVLGFLVIALIFGARSARAASSVDDIGDALRDSPVYVDPAASQELSSSQSAKLAKTIEHADTPTYVAVLPQSKQYDKSRVLDQIHQATGRSGVYAVLIGDDLGAGATSGVLPGSVAKSMANSSEHAHPDDVPAMLHSFVVKADKEADQHGGQNGRGYAGGGSLWPLLVTVGALGAGGLLLSQRTRARQRKDEATQLAEVRTTIDEDITAYGEALDELDFHPSSPGGGTPETDAALNRDYEQALDAYEKAKRAVAHAERPADIQQVTEALEEGRFALVTLRARRQGEELPSRRPPCFFDPRHGPSVRDVVWAPEHGQPRDIPVCAADATRLEDGEPPMIRTVHTADGRRPYWEAGPAYGPWAGGYFGAFGGMGMFPGLLMGTMLGQSIGFGLGGGAAGGDFGGGFGDNFNGGMGGGLGGMGGGLGGGF